MQLPRDGVFWRTEDVLRELFPRSERVSFTRVALPGDILEHVVFESRTGERVDGYAYLGEVAIAASSARGPRSRTPVADVDAGR